MATLSQLLRGMARSGQAAKQRAGVLRNLVRAVAPRQDGEKPLAIQQVNYRHHIASCGFATCTAMAMAMAMARKTLKP